MLSPTIAPSEAARMHELDAEAARAGDDAGRDRGRLARHDREERVDHRDREDDQVAPVRSGDGVDDRTEHFPHPRRGRCRDDAADGLPPTRRHPRARSDELARGADRDRDPRRARRRRRQDRASRARRRGARLGPALLRGRQRHVLLRERGQALARSRPEVSGGARGAAAARRRRRRGGAEPAAGHRGAARLRAGGAARAQSAARLRDDRRLRPHWPAGVGARLRPADAGSRGDHERHRRDRRPSGPGRRLPDRHRHRRLGRARDRGRAARGAGAHARPLALRDRALARPLPARRRARGRCAGRPPWHRLPPDRPVPGVRDRRRRADDRGRERPPLREGCAGPSARPSSQSTRASRRTRSASPTGRS